MSGVLREVAEEFLREKARGRYALHAVPGWLVWSAALVGAWIVLACLGGW